MFLPTFGEFDQVIAKLVTLTLCIPRHLPLELEHDLTKQRVDKPAPDELEKAGNPVAFRPVLFLDGAGVGQIRSP